MKFSAGIDGLTRENTFLKMILFWLLAATALLLGIVYSLMEKPPVIVERSSRGLDILRATEFARNPEDLKDAVRLMLRARFDTEAIAPEVFLNPKQMVLRDTEQKDMKARGMVQNIFVRKVEFEKEQAVVDVDRVISVGELRSALKAKVKVAFETVSPNELNPYGLLLSLADPIQGKEPEK